MLVSQLLTGSLKHVTRHGWSKDAIAASAIELGLPVTAHGLIQNGPGALVAEQMKISNTQLSIDLDNFLKQNPRATKNEIAEFAIWERLKKTIPVQSTWAQAMAIGVKPENMATTTQLLGEFADTVVSKFGEKQEGVQWYTSRTALISAYCICELHMLSDYSPELENTRQFLKDRVMVEGPRLLQSFNGAGDVLSTLTSGILTTGAAGMTLGLDLIKSFSPNSSSLLTNVFQSVIFPSSPSSSTSSMKKDDVKQEDRTYIDVKLPEHMSLFGLVSRDLHEAAEIISTNNPDFTVIFWSSSLEIPAMSSAKDPRKVVRLVHDKQNIVIDVLRI